MSGRLGSRSSAGMTLVEVLVGIVILGLIASAVAAISLTGVLGISENAQEDEADAFAAQQASLVLARDVQGAQGVVASCTGVAGPEFLVALEPSDGGPVVEYMTTTSAPYSLVRTVCDPAGDESRTVADDLSAAPAITCDGGTCTPGATPPPEVITLDVDRTATFDFALDGARRITSGNSTSGPLAVPDFISLGGDQPLSVGGSSSLVIDGNAYINRPTTGNLAVQFNGGAALEVTGQFRIQDGAICENSCANANKVPGSFAEALPDPLRFLPAPDTSTMATRTDCAIGTVGGEQRRICQPGVYPDEFPPSVGPASVKDYVLQPGVYVLQDGLKVTNGSLVGDDVTLYNQSGSISIQGADFDLTAPDSGDYARILLFQARSNASIAVLNGTMYAPASSGFELGSGGAGMTVGRIVGASLSTSGSGTVTVVGS